MGSSQRGITTQNDKFITILEANTKDWYNSPAAANWPNSCLQSSNKCQSLYPTTSKINTISQVWVNKETKVFINFSFTLYLNPILDLLKTTPKASSFNIVFTYRGPVRFSYNPSFSACFFIRNSIFLSQQISRNNISTCFFSEANGARKALEK